jgi:spore coat polysaccharide biosynthesis protein SpsF
MISLIQTLPCIQATVLGIAQGSANLPFVDLAQRRGIDYILGDETDVLKRLILCARNAQATDIFRVTTESPFFYYEKLDEAWESHLQNRSDVTTINGLPDGSHFEIYTLEALERSHEFGSARHRSEYCSLYIREHRDDFKVTVLPIPAYLERLDIRLTVDYPEDLVVCRRIYAHLRHKAPRLPVGEIIKYIDGQPELRALLVPYIVGKSYW